MRRACTIQIQKEINIYPNPITVPLSAMRPITPLKQSQHTTTAKPSQPLPTRQASATTIPTKTTTDLQLNAGNTEGTDEHVLVALKRSWKPWNLWYLTKIFGFFKQTKATVEQSKNKDKLNNLPESAVYEHLLKDPTAKLQGKYINFPNTKLLFLLI
jgi:hypothetical protein